MLLLSAKQLDLECRTGSGTKPLHKTHRWLLQQSKSQSSQLIFISQYIYIYVCSAMIAGHNAFVFVLGYNDHILELTQMLQEQSYIWLISSPTSTKQLCLPYFAFCICCHSHSNPIWKQAQCQFCSSVTGSTWCHVPNCSDILNVWQNIDWIVQNWICYKPWFLQKEGKYSPPTQLMFLFQMTY